MALTPEPPQPQGPEASIPKGPEVKPVEKPLGSEETVLGESIPDIPKDTATAAVAKTIDPDKELLDIADGDGPELPQPVATRKAFIPKDSAEVAVQQAAADQEEVDPTEQLGEDPALVFDPEAQAQENVRAEQNLENLQAGITDITTPYADALNFKAAQLSREKKARRVMLFSNHYQGTWLAEGQEGHEDRGLKLDFDKLSENSFRVKSLLMASQDEALLGYHHAEANGRLNLQFRNSLLQSIKLDWITHYGLQVADMQKSLAEDNSLTDFINNYNTASPFFKEALEVKEDWIGENKATVQIHLGAEPSITLRRQRNNISKDKRFTERAKAHEPEYEDTLVYNKKTNMFENPKYPDQPKISVDEFKAILASTLAQIPMNQIEVPTAAI